MHVLFTLLVHTAAATDLSVALASTDAPPIDFSAAEDPGTVDREQMAWLKPKLNRLPPNPRGNVDYTAYTLEWGEARVGLLDLSAGVLPRTQLGTSIPLMSGGVGNVYGKVNAATLGPVDLAITSSYFGYAQDDFRARYSGVGGLVSYTVGEHWSVHAASSFHALGAEGLPELEQLSPLLGFSLAGVEEAIAGQDTQLELTARALRARISTDWRFNRRDSVVLQAEAFVWARVMTPIEDIPEVLNLDTVLAYDGGIPLSEAYSCSAAWQFSWKRSDLRVGLGTSSVPGAWLLQSTEFAYRFGGETRLREWRTRRTWRENRRAVVAEARLMPPPPGSAAPDAF